MSRAKVRKAVIPAAGLGTRLLPASKVVPKELLPIVDTPALQVVVEELLDSGIEEIVFVTGRGKDAILDHFDVHYELEDRLEKRGKTELLEAVRRVSDMIPVVSVRQKAPLGLGHAVLCARPAIGDEPFAVLLPDDLFRAARPVTAQLVEAFEATGTGVVALLEIPREDTSKYGVIEGEQLDERLWRIARLVEKPPPEQAPSNMALPGRYVLPARVFDYLETTPRGHGGEIQLTDALDTLAANEGLHGVAVEGQRFDTGNVLGYLQANVAFALARDDVGPELARWLREQLGE
jgi:UTP--glucose-1-phosphate uridylyltransferase